MRFPLAALGCCLLAWTALRAESPTPAAFSAAAPAADAAGVRHFRLEAPAPGAYRVVLTLKNPGDARAAALELRADDGIRRPRRIDLPARGVRRLDAMRLDFAGAPRALAVRTGDDVQVQSLECVPLPRAEVPPEAREYRPAVLPPAGHPRVLATPALLPVIRARLTLGENRAAWETVKRLAAAPFPPAGDPETELAYDAPLLEQVRAKAFYHLMTGEAKPADEAIARMLDYWRRVEFGAAQDISREIGESIYTAALLYDYCCDRLTPAQRQELIRRALGFAGEMEIGWPPFREPALYGHANEAQISRDLLSMGIAVYDEFPDLYRYCAYALAEVSAPAKNYAFSSGRHDQGTAYGNYRFAWDLHGVLLFRRMAGAELLEPAYAARVPYRWLYLRTPSGALFREGDDFFAGAYPGNQLANLLAASLYRDPLLKAEAFRIAPPEAVDPVLLLLVNDPRMRADDAARAALPLTCFYPEPLGGMVARTGWNRGPAADDAVAVMNGAGYHFRNHHHFDAGAFQLYYRGFLLADLGLYRGYGNPYDWNFHKSSVSHNTLLIRDPERPSLCGPRFSANSGTQDAPGFLPFASLAEQLADDTFRNGSVPAHGFGPDPMTPEYSFLMTDLALSYRTRVNDCRRLQLFWNTGEPERPGIFLVYDTVSVVNPRSEVFFQLNSPVTPRMENGRLEYAADAVGKPGRLSVRMLLPETPKFAVLTGEEVFRIDGKLYKPGFFNDFANIGSRTQISTGAPGDARFLAVMQLRGEAPERPVRLENREGMLAVTVGDRVTVFPANNTDRAEPFRLTVTSPRARVLCLNLAPGEWRAQGPESATLTADDTSHAIFLADLPAGEYRVFPVGARRTPPPTQHALWVRGKPFLRFAPGEVPAVPLKPLLAACGIAGKETAAGFVWECRGVELRLSEAGLFADDCRWPVQAERRGADYFLPPEAAAAVTGHEPVRDEVNDNWLFRPADDPRWSEYLMLAGGGVNRADWIKLALTRRQRWTATGSAELLMLFRAPRRLRGLKFLPGIAPAARITLEGAPHGDDFKPLFEGAPPAPASDGFIALPFPPGAFRAIRLKLAAATPASVCGISSFEWMEEPEATPAAPEPTLQINNPSAGKEPANTQK